LAGCCPKKRKKTGNKGCHLQLIDSLIRLIAHKRKKKEQERVAKMQSIGQLLCQAEREKTGKRLPLVIDG